MRFVEAVQRKDIDLLERLLGEDFTLTTGRPGKEVCSRDEWLGSHRVRDRGTRIRGARRPGLRLLRSGAEPVPATGPNGPVGPQHHLPDHRRVDPDERRLEVAGTSRPTGAEQLTTWLRLWRHGGRGHALRPSSSRPGTSNPSAQLSESPITIAERRWRYARRAGRLPAEGRRSNSEQPSVDLDGGQHVPVAGHRATKRVVARLDISECSRPWTSGPRLSARSARDRTGSRALCSRTRPAGPQRACWVLACVCAGWCERGDSNPHGCDPTGT